LFDFAHIWYRVWFWSRDSRCTINVQGQTVRDQDHSNKKLRYREQHGASVVHSWCTLWHLSWENLLVANHVATKASEFGEIRQSNGQYAFQGHSTLPILEQSKAHMRLPLINTNLPLILHRFQVMAACTCMSFFPSVRSRFTSTFSLGVILCEYRHKWYTAKTYRFFGLHFTRRMYRCIFNHVYVIGPQSYRVPRNNANYTAITPFKVVQGHFGTNRKPISDFLLVINSNLPPNLHRLQVIADYCQILAIDSIYL